MTIVKLSSEQNAEVRKLLNEMEDSFLEQRIFGDYSPSKVISKLEEGDVHAAADAAIEEFSNQSQHPSIQDWYGELVVEFILILGF